MSKEQDELIVALVQARASIGAHQSELDRRTGLYLRAGTKMNYLGLALEYAAIAEANYLESKMLRNEINQLSNEFWGRTYLSWGM